MEDLMNSGTHHFCAGSCGYNSSDPGTCSAEGCSSNGKEFTSCSCDNPSMHNAKSETMDSTTS